jgi:spore germination protein GerM
MNFSQKFGIFCLIVITAAYVYFSFFNKDGFHLPAKTDEQPIINTNENINTNPENPEIEQPRSHEIKNVKIFVTDSKGKLRSVNRKCDTSVEKSCFAFAIKELIAAPTQWEKNKGLSSEIPSNTKILSVREGSNNILIDLSSAFESGGGAESTYIRVHQLIKTSQANSKLPVFLYINGKQADVIGGEGIMIKQPLSERSLDD